jgi:hypothetical protein
MRDDVTSDVESSSTTSTVIAYLPPTERDDHAVRIHDLVIFASTVCKPTCRRRLGLNFV